MKRDLQAIFLGWKEGILTVGKFIPSLNVGETVTHSSQEIISVFSKHYGKLFRQNEAEIGQEIDEYLEGTRPNKLTKTKALNQDFAQEGQKL